MAEIELTQGKITEVDEADLPVLAPYAWYAIRRKRTWYAQTNSPAGLMLMHRLLVGVEGVGVDHIDGNGLNNRRVNLRVANQTQNNANQRVRAGGSSRFKGVSWSEERSKWVAQIAVNGKRRNLGRFLDEEEAARTYDRAALDAFGTFARTNEMMGLYQTPSPVPGTVVPSAL